MAHQHPHTLVAPEGEDTGAAPFAPATKPVIEAGLYRQGLFLGDLRKFLRFVCAAAEIDETLLVEHDGTGMRVLQRLRLGEPYPNSDIGRCQLVGAAEVDLLCLGDLQQVLNREVRRRLVDEVQGID